MQQKLPRPRCDVKRDFSRNSIFECKHFFFVLVEESGMIIISLSKSHQYWWQMKNSTRRKSWFFSVIIIVKFSSKSFHSFFVCFSRIFRWFFGSLQYNVAIHAQGNESTMRNYFANFKLNNGKREKLKFQMKLLVTSNWTPRRLMLHIWIWVKGWFWT